MSRHGPALAPGQSCLSDDQSLLAAAVSSAVTTVTLLVAFALLALGVEQFWVTFVLGFGVVLPAALTAVKHAETDREQPAGSGTDPDTLPALDELRERYARGEMGDDEFERRLERLLEAKAESEFESGISATADEFGTE